MYSEKKKKKKNVDVTPHEKKKNIMLDPGFEPGLPRPQRGVLTSRLIER